MVYDCTNRNYSFTEAIYAWSVSHIPIADIQETITKERTKCATNDYEVRCIYCQIELELGLVWE